MIGHLTARMIGTRPPIELDLDAVFAAAAAHHTALEINGGLPRLDLSVETLRRANAYAIDFVLTSDAHHTPELERVRYAALNAERAGIAPERVVNTWAADKLAAWAIAKV
jgi:DNA polymerase (family X)